MGKYIIRRLLRSIPVVIFVSILVYGMVDLLPGDPALHMFSGQYMSAETIAKARETLGLDKPVYVRYWQWLTSLFRGDLGESIVSKRPVVEMLASVWPRTIELALAAMAVTALFGVAAGIVAAIKKDTWIDTIVMFITSLGVSMPLFWIGLIALLYFSVKLRWFPIAEGAGWKSLVLPAVVLGFQSACLVARLTRSSVLQVLREDYITTARSKGLRGRRVMLIHVLRNAFIPVLTVLGVQTSWLLGGTVITETVFARPGLGKLSVEAVRQMDFPVLQAIVLFASVLYVTINLLIDIFNAYLDPRISYE
jgi:ABC-type dipeptide/oligopeptide/nickel transport system permease component